MNRNNGFTLIEIVIALAIIGILAATATLTFASFKKKSVLATGYANACSLRASLITFACTSTDNCYPEKISNWSDLVKICRTSGSTIDETASAAGFKDWIEYTPVNPDGDGKIEDFLLRLRVSQIKNTTPGAQLKVTTAAVVKETY